MKNDLQIDPIYWTKNMITQMAEISGKVTKDHEFHSLLYKDLLNKVVPLRREYRKLPDIEGRK